MVAMVSEALAIITRFSWIDCREKFFTNKEAWHPYKAHLQHISDSQGQFEKGAFEDTVETRVTGSFPSGAFKDYSSKSD